VSCKNCKRGDDKNLRVLTVIWDFANDRMFCGTCEEPLEIKNDTTSSQKEFENESSTTR